MRLQCQSNGRYINLEPASTLGVGGEACIYAATQEPSLVAKVYHRPTEERARKLAAMLANPPDDPMVSQKHVSIAWPIDLLCSADGKTVGFLMPRVAGMHSILDFYNPRTRRQHCPLFNYLYLHRTARNLAAAVRALHERGYVIGDVNESNILVADTALVTLVDTDSFQVCDPYSGAVYRCTVGKPEFTPPELQGKTFASIDRSPEHDLFGLAVLIFQLLMEGTHPFSGTFQGEGEPPSYQERISAGHFPYSGKRCMTCHPALTAPPFETLNPALRKLFIRCFRDGLKKPRVRPDARTWQSALDNAENTLVTCPVNDQHLYGGHLKVCPWCERSAQLGGRDPFPSRQSVQSGQHLRPVPPTQRPLSPAGRPAAPRSRRKPDNQKAIHPAFWLSGPPAVWAWASLGMGTAAVLVMLLTALLIGENLPWRLLLTCEATLGPAALVCGVISWRQAKMWAGRGRWLSGAALGMGTAAVASVLLFVAYLIAKGNLPWRLSLIFVVLLGATALVWSAVSWRWVKMLLGRGRWVASAALGIGAIVILLSLLALLEVFMLVGNRLYLATLVSAVVLGPAALACGTTGWERVRDLARQKDLWFVSASSSLLAMFMILCGQLYVAAMVYAVLLVGTTTLVCVFDWQRVRALVRRGRWTVGAALGMGTIVAILALLLVALLVRERL